MIEITEKSNCCGCTACANKCPRNAIKMVEDDKGFLYPYIDRKKCINCGLCDKVCPIINKRKTENYPKAYAAINKDEKIRLNSSSGGIFSALANYILEEQGIIFGAAFSDDFLVKHIMIDNKDDLYKLRTSKYLQSSLGDIYKEVEKKLNEGKKVLFTGTSCQINGLYGYLNKIYENLYTQDIICHGVPSPKVWKNYLKYRQEKDLESPTKINFREKTIGWSLFSLLFQYEKGEYNRSHKEDLFMQAFLRNACLRESCYNCSFKDKHRISDITLADFWGIQDVEPSMNDDKGTSLVIVNSKKGEELFEKIFNNIESKQVDFEKSIQHNPSMYMSVKKPKGYDDFFNNLGKMEFDKLVKKYTISNKKSIVKRMIRKIKRILLKS